jgi:predicted dehydrogenase
MEGVAVVAVCDNDLPKAQALAARFSIRNAFDDIEDLLSYAKPGAVVICTPNHLHEVHISAALSAGAHVLCERPLALSAAGVERIIAARERAGRIVMVGMNHRFRSDVQAVREFVRRGELGQIKTVRAGWYLFRPTRGGADWRRRRAESGGGALLDLGLPLLDLAFWLGGMPEPCQVTGSVSASQGAVEDSGCALIVCRHGFSIFVDVSWRHLGEAERFWVDLAGEKGAASVAPLRVFKETHGGPINVTPTGAAGRENPFTASYRSEWAYFLAATQGGVDAPDLNEQLMLQRLTETIYRSAEEGRDVVS